MENKLFTKEEWKSLLGKQYWDTLGEPPGPLVAFSYGNYSIRGSIIFYCPWCGTKLPLSDPRQQFPTADIVEIAVDFSGQITVNGELISAGETIPEAVKRIREARLPDNS